MHDQGTQMNIVRFFRPFALATLAAAGLLASVGNAHATWHVDEPSIVSNGMPTALRVAFDRAKRDGYRRDAGGVLLRMLEPQSPQSSYALEEKRARIQEDADVGRTP